MRNLSKVVVASGAALALTLTGAAAEAAPNKPTAKPTKVVTIVVDALSREIVETFDMKNVKALMDKGVDTPKGSLGHLGSVTVVTHNVITTGLLPKHMGWTDDGWRDTQGLLPGAAANPFWIPSDWSKDQMFTVQNSIGKRRLPDYLHAANPGSKVIAISPKGYAAYAYGGPTADSIITFGSTTTCNGVRAWRGPAGVNVPSYIAAPCGRYFVHHSSLLTYDTSAYPASLYPLDGDRYTTGKDDEHLGGDIWATDIALDVMDHENWSGIFLTLPGVDKSAHMWGGVDDTGGADPMTHLAFAAKTADEQVGRVMAKLRASGELDNTIVVLTADHGSVPGRNFHGTASTDLGYGYYNWYYGATNNGTYLQPPAALEPLVASGNVGVSYSDSMLRAWLKDQSPAKVAEAVAAYQGMPGVTAVWIRNGDHYDMVGKPNNAAMTNPGEMSWFKRNAQQLVDTEAAAYGPDVIATLADDTTYSILGDHGGIQRRSQQIPIVFAGAGTSAKDLQADVRSVDIMPTVLRAMGITPDAGLDGIGYDLIPGAAR